jgi:type IV pilus assembly protein PilZ
VFEKRRHPRQTVDLKASLHVEGTDEIIDGQVKDLSIGGMFFLSDSKLPFGTKVKALLAFPPPSGQRELAAVVRWAAEDGIGLQFGLLGAQETHAIALVLRKR